MTKRIIKDIPLFPLNLCLLPGEDLPLKIFEPRYKQLINDCNIGGYHFGIPYRHNQQMHGFGTEVKINQIIARNSLGEMVISIEGVSNFELLDFNDPLNDKLYSSGLVKEVINKNEIKDKELIRRIIYYSESINPEFLSGFNGQTLRPVDIAIALNLSSEDKLKFISLSTQKLRENFIRFNIDTLYKLAEQEILLKKDFSLN